MKVILLEKFRKLGQVGDVVEVKNGYARNFLIPNQKAIQANKESIRSFEEKRGDLLAQSQKNEKEANELSEKIKNKIIVIIKQSADDGRLYGAVTTSEISEGLNKLAETNIDKKQVVVTTAIKSIGFYQVELDLGEGVFAPIYLNVARSEGEAQEIEKKFLSGEITLGSFILDRDKRKAS